MAAFPGASWQPFGASWQLFNDQWGLLGSLSRGILGSLSGGFLAPYPYVNFCTLPLGRTSARFLFFDKFKRTVARSHHNALRVHRALDAQRASLATVATVGENLCLHHHAHVKRLTALSTIPPLVPAPLPKLCTNLEGCRRALGAAMAESAVSNSSTRA